MINQNDEFKRKIFGCVKFIDNGIDIIDAEKLISKHLDSIVHTSVFGEPETAFLARRIIRKAAFKKNIHPSSIFNIYKKIANGEITGLTVPAFNIRVMTYDIARVIFEEAIKHSAFPFIFEIARSEIEYSNQTPDEYAVCILAGALRAGWQGEVFIQGDHFQVNPERFSTDRDSELSELKNLILKALKADFYHIDIDASTLVDLSKPSVFEQQRNNFEITAELTKFIRDVEKGNLIVVIGGEIGEVGKKNTTPEELRAFMEGYNKTLRAITPTAIGLSKISIQTGTSHGGVVLPDGSIMQVSIDFNTMKELSKIVREEFNLSGIVQHGASTLPDSLLHKIRETGCLEIHLATEFQNLIFDHPSFPFDLLEDIKGYLDMFFNKEKKRYTDEQFFYKMRKFATGRFKREIWDLDESIKDQIKVRIGEKVRKIFNELGVAGRLGK